MCLLKKNIAIVLLALLCAGCLITSIQIYGDKQTATKNISHVRDELEQVEQINSQLKESVKSENTNTSTHAVISQSVLEFAQAFLNYTSNNQEERWQNVANISTETFLNTFRPTDTNYMESDTVYTISLVGTNIFQAEQDEDTHANTLNIVTINTTVNDITTESNILLGLNMVYDETIEKWLVNDMPINEPLSW